MFPQLPTTIDQMQGGSDAAPLVDAAVGWARVEAASAAQRFAALAEWAAVFLADEDDDSSLCAIDGEDDVVTQIGLAFGISTRRAFHDLQVGAAMRERFPRLAALFLRGEISAQVMATVVDRTFLVVDDEALANIDRACAEAATTCGWSNLSYYTLKNAIDVWIERFDPDAVRRVHNNARGRGVTVDRTDDQTGITTLTMRLTKPGAALLMAKLRTMAKGVCPNDPRTLEQRLGDAAEALGADANRLKCLCGSDTCAAAADDGVASKFVIHIYGDADLADAQPDPLIHGDGVSTRPDNATIKYPKGKKTKATADAPAAKDESAPNAEPAQPDTDQEPGSSSRQRCAAPAAEPAPADEPVVEAADEPGGADGEEAAAEPSPIEAEMNTSAGTSETAEDATADDTKPPETEPDEPASDQEPGSSTPRHCPAPATPDAEPLADNAAEITSPSASATVGRAPGFTPGFGVVPNALIAALIAAGAEVHHIKPPNTEPTESYRLRDADREFVQARDLTCRMPNCNRPIHDTDLDHTITWGDGGPTHPSNEKGYCRRDHLLKTFRDGWSEVQNPDGTLEITTPTGHTYTSIPLSRILFPRVNTTSAPVQRGSPRKQAAADKMSKMPKRRRTKAKDRDYRIQAERALNAAYRAAGGTPTNGPAPKDDFGYRLFFGEYTQKADPNDPPPF